MKDVDIKCQLCFDTYGREFKLIKANDSDSDLYTEKKSRSFKYNNVRRVDPSFCSSFHYF